MAPESIYTDQQQKSDDLESENELIATADRIIPFNITFVAGKIVIATPSKLIELNQKPKKIERQRNLSKEDDMLCSVIEVSPDQVKSVAIEGDYHFR